MGAPVSAGDVVAGKYRVERVLGEGGMGVVVAARHLHLDQVVALKFLLPDASANPEALGRFVREARNAARLKSEHVARIIDVDTLQTGTPYIVMEYLEGTDLGGLLAQRGTLPVELAVEYVLQACDAIAEAHAAGIVHRDLKPQNLFVTRRNDRTSLVKVLDFGISKSIASGRDFAATRTQAVMGSPAYMSPEQMRSSKLVDSRTDVWSLGVILYELVTGRVPWEAETFTELCLKVAMDPMPPFPTMGAVPAAFVNVVQRCLEKDPQRRLANVHDLAVALSPFAPAHAQPLVKRIALVLSAEVAERPSMPRILSPDAGTLREAAGQREPRTSVRPSTRKVFTLVAGTAVLASLIVTAVALSGKKQADRAVGAPDNDRAAAPVAPGPAPQTDAPPVHVAPAQPSPSPPPAPTTPLPTAGTADAVRHDVATTAPPASIARPAETTAKRAVPPAPLQPKSREREHRGTQPSLSTAAPKTPRADPLSSPD